MVSHKTVNKVKDFYQKNVMLKMRIFLYLQVIHGSPNPEEKISIPTFSTIW